MLHLCNDGEAAKWLQIKEHMEPNPRNYRASQSQQYLVILRELWEVKSEKCLLR